MDAFVIRDISGVGTIEFLRRELVDPQRGVESVLIRLTSLGLLAEGTADMAQFPDELIAELDRDWEGWDGEREWQSLEHELALNSTHERYLSHVRIVATLTRRSGWTDFTWETQVAVVIACGDLQRLAREAAVFFAPRRPESDQD